MGKKSTVIHCNRGLIHQVRIAEALRSGFLTHGIEAAISLDANTVADIHVVMGPWFAFNQWRYHKTLYIDRAYWKDPECVSVHWLVDGEKRRDIPKWERSYPELKPVKQGDRRIYLCDYGAMPEGIFHTVRHHPSQVKPTRTLVSDLEAHDVAIGRRTTALVDAALMGLRVETCDPHSPVWGLADRVKWAKGLAWHNWSIDEIASGEMINAIGSND